MLSNNKLLKKILGNTGVEVKGNHSDNFYLKRIAENTLGGGSVDLTNVNNRLDVLDGLTIEHQSVAESGYLATYVLKKDGVVVGDKINIPKDYLVKSATLETVNTANAPVQGYNIGDKYLDFVINSKDNTGTVEHIFVLVSDLVDFPSMTMTVNFTDETTKSYKIYGEEIL